MNQRDALARSRERLQLISTRRDTSAAQLEALWADVRRLSTSTDATVTRELSAKISGMCTAVDRDYPARRTGVTTQRSTATRFGVVLAVGATMLLQRAPANDADARALLSRAQPESALVVLSAAGDSSATTLALIGQAELQRGSRRSLFTRFSAARRARTAFMKALERDSTRVDALESLSWIARLLPPLIGGSTSDAERFLRRLERQSPYRGALMSGYFARTNGQNAVAESTFRNLVTTAPDSAPAWFALGDLAYRLGNADAALESFRRFATLMPTDRAVQFHLGQLAALHGVGLADAENSLRDYIRGPVLLTQPTVDTAWWRLGQVLEKRGKIEPARDAYRKAIAIDRRNDDFAESLRTLEAASRGTSSPPTAPVR